MIGNMKSISPKQGADDVINQILHTFPFFSPQSSTQPGHPFFIVCEWIPSGRIDMDFTNNLS